MKVNFANVTGQNIAFEAQILTMQGGHVTVRASLPAGKTTAVELPSGVTYEMLATCPQVLAELNRASPRYTVAPVLGTTPLPAGLSDYDVIRRTQTTAASVAAPGFILGLTFRPGSLGRLRMVNQGATIVGETYTIDDILVNGVSLAVPAPSKPTIVASKAARGVVDVDLKALLGAAKILVADNAQIALVTTYTNPGAGTLAAVHFELQASKG
jgi:hypothetical protein